MDESECVKVKLSSKIGKKAPVFLADFPMGQLKENSKVKFDCFKSNRHSEIDEVYTMKNAERILTADTNHLSYKGSSSDGSDESSRQAPQYFVGVRNTNTGKMKLYDSMFFHMKPKLIVSAPTVTLNNPSENNYWDDVNKLTVAFGTKVKKRMLNSRIKLAVNEESFEDSIQSNSFDVKPLQPNTQTESSQLSYLPTVNRKAESLDEVFDLSEILWPEEDIALQELAKNLIQNFSPQPDNFLQNFCTFTKQHIVNVLEDPTKVKYLLYYNYLIMFQNLSYADIRKKDPCPLIPEPIKESLLKKFTFTSKSESGRSTRVIPPQQKDKLLAHILILALHVLEYNVNINDILADLKRGSTKQFNSIAETMGCYVTSRSIDGQAYKFAELKLPLNFIPPKYSKRQF